MKFKYILLILMLATVSIMPSCNNDDPDPPLPPAIDSMSVDVDNEMIKILFPNQKNVLTGADGAISVHVGGNKSYWIWGDSFWGEVIGNRRSTQTPMISGNTFQYVEGNTATSLVNGTPTKPKAWIENDSVNGYYSMIWPMHGFVKNNIMHLLAEVMLKTGTGGFDFQVHALRYYRLQHPGLVVIDYVDLPQAIQNNVHYGLGFYEHNGYYYTYGSQSGWLIATLHVARAQLVDDKLQNWEYYSNNGWSTDPMQSKILDGAVNDIMVSEQFSVFPYEDKFILVTQDRLLPDIYTFVADRPEGPWYNKKLVYKEPEGSNKSLYTYNAMAHTQYDKDGKLLVSYCVNAVNFADLYSNVNNYRPRFIRVPYALMLSK